MPDRPEGGLKDLAPTSDPVSYLRELWRARDLALTLALNDHQAEHGSKLLGALWHLINPLAQIAVYGIVFGALLGGRRPDGFLVFLAVGVFLFGALQKGVTDAAFALERGQAFVRELTLPRALLPLAAVLQAALAFRWQVLLIIALALIADRAIATGAFLFVIIVLPQLFLLTFGAGLIWARLTSDVRDLSGVLQIGFRLLLFASGVMFPLESVLGPSGALTMELLNPAAGVLAVARHLLVTPIDSPLAVGLAVTGWSIASVVIGLAFFARGEAHYGNP